MAASCKQPLTRLEGDALVASALTLALPRASGVKKLRRLQFYFAAGELAWLAGTLARPPKQLFSVFLISVDQMKVLL